MSHVTDHCELPRIRRRDRRAGTVWACSCGRLYRTTEYGSMDGSYWSWSPLNAS